MKRRGGGRGGGGASGVEQLRVKALTGERHLGVCQAAKPQIDNNAKSLLGRNEAVEQRR